MTDKLSIKEQMRAIDCRDMQWWDSLSADELKKVSPWVMMRYTSACDSNHDQIRDHYLTMTNALVNVHYNDISHHPQLQHRLLQIVGIGKSQYHPWIPPGKRGSKNPIEEFLIKMYPLANEDEIAILMKMDKDEITQLAEDAGMSDKEIKALFKKKK